MLTGHNLVYFAPGPWHDLWRPKQQLLSIFARHNKVLFVEPRPHLRSTLADFRQSALGLQDLRRPCLEQLTENLYVYRYPVWAVTSGRPPLRELTRALRRFSIKTTLHRLHMSQPIVWFSQPAMIDMIDDIPSARLRLYHVIDEYSSYSGHTPASRRRIQQVEKKMMSQVDAVVVVSEKLYETKSGFNRHTYVVPNGVNYQAYSTALADPSLPEDLRAIRPPRLGYIGLVDDRLDLGMLRDLAEEHPEWSLVFLGMVRLKKQSETWQTLVALPNVHLLGPVEVSQVPHYVKGFQVGLMPYRSDLFAENCSPLKLYDYLAAGIPIASIEMPPIRPFESCVHIARRPQDFAQAVRAALLDTTPERFQMRRQIAGQHTWEARVEQLSEVIETLLAVRASKEAQVRAPVH